MFSSVISAEIYTGINIPHISYTLSYFVLPRILQGKNKSSMTSHGMPKNRHPFRVSWKIGID